MARRYHQRQAEELYDDGYEWGSHRGGGGSPLRNADGRPISKLGTVINGHTKVDNEKYNGLNGSNTTNGISIREITRPSTSYHAPSHNTAHIFDPAPAVNVSSPVTNVPITPIRHQQKGQYTQLRLGDSNATEVLTHNLQKSNRVRVTNLVQEQHSHQHQHQQQHPHYQPPSHRQHIPPHDDHDLKTQQETKQHSDDTNNTNNNDQANVFAAISCNNSQQAELLKEISDLKLITKKQIMLQSFRWGLANLDLIEECTCIGNRGGEEVNQKSLKAILKEILLDFMKGKSHNIGIRKPFHYKNEHNQSQTEDKFHVLVSESLHLLCGAEPIFSRRPDGDCDVFIGIANY